MLGVSGLVERSGDDSAAGAPPPEGGGGGGGDVAASAATTSMSRNDNSVVFGDDENARIIEEGERNSAGNRWPRQETLALLKIRSDMDVAFRDSSVKGPLWDEVSRKLAELGFHRSAKKCKEKFENVYKYHKRTKEGRSTKSDGKTYRFFDQLEALDQNHPSFSLMSSPPPPPPQPPKAQPSSAVPTLAMPVSSNPPIVMSQFNHLTTLSSSINPTHSHTNTIAPNIFTITPSLNNPTMVISTQPNTNTHSNPHIRASSLPNFRPTTSSSSTSSDEELHGRQTNKKRKWKEFFEGLMKEVIERQEQLQKKFLETIEKREHDRMAREEAWRMQEMSRLNREHEILVQERSMAAAKDTAVMAFLQKLSEQHQIPVQLFQSQDITFPQQAHPSVQVQPEQAHAAHVQMIQTQVPQPQQLPPLTAQQAPAPQPSPARAKVAEIPKPDNGNHASSTSSRWPKSEVQALIKLRTNLDLKYQESGPKGPLWEEISSGMKRLGYNRNAKRCKEKWENINKYFKKVKESNKQRPEDSKTCPYYHLLDALYKARNKSGGDIFPSYGLSNKSEDAHSNNPTDLAPLMVQPEQQWPPLPLQEAHHRQGNIESQNVYQNKEEEDEEEDDLEDEDDEGDEEDDNGAAYEIVANKQQAAGSMSATE